MNRLHRKWIAIYLAAAIAGAGIGWQVTKIKAQPTIAAPFATSVSVTTSSATLIGANPTRRALTICTPANTNVVAIAPAPVTPAQPAGPGIIITGSATASTCFSTALVQSSGSSGGVGAAWNAVASATTNVLVLEY